MDALCLWIESLCSARLVCWGFCWDKLANLKSCDGPLAGPSKQPDLSLAPHASCLISPATGEWFQHSDPCCSGTGLWLLGKAGFFSAPASCQHGACPSPASGVSSHSGWISMSPLMRRWTRECLSRQEQSELCLISVSSPVSSYDNWFATEAIRTSWDTKAWECVILLGFQALHWLLVIPETYWIKKKKPTYEVLHSAPAPCVGFWLHSTQCCLWGTLSTHLLSCQDGSLTPPWLELSLPGDRIGSLLFWGIVTWERSLCFGRENRSKTLRNFPVVFIISWMLVVLSELLCVQLVVPVGFCTILTIKGLHCFYFSSDHPHARWTGCMQFINKYLLFWAVTEREGISWLWIAGRVGICWLWSARRFQNLEVIIPFSLCDPCPCLLCTPVPYSRASLAKINTLSRLLPPPPCRKCLLAQGYEWLCCLVGKGDKGLLWGHYPIPPAFSGAGVKVAKLGPGFSPESCLLPPVLGSSAGNVVKMLRLLSAHWVFGMLGLLPSELDRHKSPEDGLCVGIDVSGFGVFNGCSWDVGKLSKGMTCGIDANCTFRSDPRHLELFPVFRIILKYQHDVKNKCRIAKCMLSKDFCELS